MRLAHYLCCIFICILHLSAPPAMAEGGNTRVILGFPVYVKHPDNRTRTQDWNEGWFHNEGMLIDLSWPTYRFGTATGLRAGITGGVFENSINNTSVFLGGMVEIELHATDPLAFSLGTYAGGITGYETSPAPAIAPYLGIAYAVTERVELGLREFWLPARTIGGGKLARSDAYVLAVTLGTRF